MAIPRHTPMHVKGLEDLSRAMPGEARRSQAKQKGADGKDKDVSTRGATDQKLRKDRIVGYF
jgi:hypothetical protein